MKEAAPVEGPNWQQIVGALMADFGDEHLEPEAVAFLHQLAQTPVQPWLVACSGGADSLLLTLWLYGRFAGAGQSLILVHYDHQLRTESAADAGFVAQLGRKLNLQVRVGHWSVQTRTEPVRQLGLEAAARAARYRFFEEVARDTGAQVLLTGHHADDLLENGLLRLARGGSWQSLTSPWPVRRFNDFLTRVRPLLTLSAEVIRQSLRRAGAVWREDSSNASPVHLRNRLRTHLLPAIREVYPAGQMLQGMLRMRRDLQELQTMVEQQAGAILQRLPSGDSLPVASLRPLPLPVIKEALRQWLWREFRVFAPLHTLHAVAAALHANEPQATWNLPENQCLALRSGLLVWVPGTPVSNPKTEVPGTSGFLVPGTCLWLPDGAWLGCERLEVAHQTELSGLDYPHWLRAVDVTRCGYVAAEVVGPLRVRYWQPGDRWQPLGLQGGSRKLQDDFINAKVPAGERHHIPLILDAWGKIIWVPGFPVSFDARLPADPPLYALRLTYRAI